MKSPDSSRRLVIVHNTNSTGARHVEKEVLQPLNDASIRYKDITTRYADTEANIDDIARQLRNGDVVLNAAGDGTALQVANAMLTSRVDAEVGFLPYGNFNDLALSHMSPKDSVIDLLQADTVDAIPLAVALDGKLWRRAPNYMTFGWTALAASQFGNERSRKMMQKAPRPLKIALSLAQLANSYLHYGDEKLPPFTTTESSQLDGQPATDILAVNSPHLARLVHLQQPFYNTTDFGYKEIDVTQFSRNIRFGMQALTSGAPLNVLNNGVSIHFEQPVRNLPVQTDGEFAQVNVQNVRISKNREDTLHVLHTKKD